MLESHFSILSLKTRLTMGQKAADDAAALLVSLLKSKDTVNMVFAAAPSQNEMLDALAGHSEIDFSRINALHMDEYIGLEPNAPQSFGTYLKNHIFERVSFRNVFYIHGWEKDIPGECRRYSELFTRFKPDIILMGIGENGHIAFNDPGVADFHDNAIIKPVQLDEVCRMQQVHDGCFPNLEAVPTHALSLTVPALMQAQHHICVVPGKTKAFAVRETVLGSVTERTPASILRFSSDARLYLDNESASELRV